jgi:hypothetical protein
MIRDEYKNWQVCGFVLVLLALANGCNGTPDKAVPPREGWEVRQESAANRHTDGNSRREDDSSRITGQTSGARYDLQADEQRGGHSVRKHVGRTDDELRERLDRERDISASSTWTDLTTAEETVGAALRAERDKIARWEEQGERRRNLALHYDAGRVIGRSITHGASQSEPCTRAVIVLRADGQGFFVLTTYPEAR